MENKWVQNDKEQVPPDIRAAIDDNLELKSALEQSPLPRRFKAMVLGLSTLRQLNTGQDEKPN